MSYKVTRANEAVKYEAPGHFDVLTTRLHNPVDVNGGTIVNGLSHFLPGGGANVAPANFEMIYYIISGEMTVTLFAGRQAQGNRRSPVTRRSRAKLSEKFHSSHTASIAR